MNLTPHTLQKEHESWLAWKPYDPAEKHKIRFAKIRNLSLRLLDQRLLWLESGFYDRLLIEKQGRELLRELNKERGAYKRYLKAKVGADEFAHQVVDALI